MQKTNRTSDFGYDVVVFFPGDWDTPFRGKYLMEALAEKEKNSKILCVERPVDLVTSPIKSPSRWIKQTIGRGKFRKLKDNLFVFRPRIFLNEHVAANIPLAIRINVTWLRDQLQRIMYQYSFDKKAIIIWVFDPLHESFINMFEGKLSIFDCYDEYTSVESLPIIRTKQQIQIHEKKLLQKANITFVVSDVLYKGKSTYANRIFILPNAADVRHFRPLLGDELRVPSDIATVPKPIIGYLGGLSNLVDIPLLCMLAEKHPEWSFVSIGSKTNRFREFVAFERLVSMGNVYVLGFRQYEQLPYYINTFNVCLLPLLADHPFNIYCSPLKMYEYLATGKPIVSTDIPHVRRFSSVIRIGKNAEDIEAHIKECLKENINLKEQRMKVARENTWESRVTEMMSIIKDEIENRNKTKE